ncbi:Peptidase family M50 [uncultured archaeon]|nr:Peptidase family M50 [uncultured archaeon]
MLNLIDITSFLTSYWYLVVLILTYVILVAFLDGRGILNKYNITAHYFLGFPILMIRTNRGQGFLDRLAVHKRFWRTFANIGLPAMLLGMLAMFILVLRFDIYLISAFQTNTVPPPGKFSELRNIFLIPGINEFIPLWYGIIALIVTLAVHEFSHAVLCKVEGIKVKSMGILLAVVPIGGFAEPDEEQLLGKNEEKAGNEGSLEQEPKKLATRNERVRVLTSGVMANFVTALIAFILFFSLLSYISPVGEVMVTNVIAGSPAEMAGIKTGMIITGINNTQINNGNDFLLYSRTLQPGSNVTLELIDRGVRKETGLVAAAGNETRTAVKVDSVIEGSPAEAAGIKKDMVLVRIDDTEIKGIEDVVAFMNSTRPGQKLDIYFMSNSSSPVEFKNVELANHPEPGVQKGFLGIIYSAADGAISYSLGIGIGQFQAKSYLRMLTGIPSLLTEYKGWILLIGLPIIGLTGEGFPGFSGLITNFYEPTGPAVYFGAGIFVMLNILMWIGWMNFYVGLFNCLPAVPLDGGHVFRDVMTSSLSKVIGNGEKVENISNAIVVIFAILILFSLLFVMFAPYAAHGI